MFLLLFIPKNKWLTRLFSFIPVWTAMVALVFGIGLFVRNINLELVLEIFLGILTALFFARLSAALKQKMVTT
jgi:hypothetical protein